MAKHTYDYPRPAVSADCLVLGWGSGALQLLLIQRGNDPFKGCWALPGGFLDMDENLDVAAKRELTEETGLANVSVEQLYTFGDVGRDPRARVITVAYLAMVRMSDHRAKAADDAVDARWFPLRQLPELAFDHDQIVETLLRTLRLRIRCQPFGAGLLADSFSMSELQALYENVLGTAIDAEWFRAALLHQKWLVQCDGDGAGQELRFDEQAYQSAVDNGCSLDLW